MSIDDCVARARAAVGEKHEDALFDYEDRLRRHGAIRVIASTLNHQD
jgi:hypothetical protein